MTPEQLEIARENAQRIVNAGGTDAIDYPVAVGFLSLIAQVEALTVPQWIETKNQRPLENQQVFVCIVHKYNNAPTAYNVSIAYYYNGEFRESGHYLQTPSHWKPFQYPAAPTIPAIPGTKEGA